MEDLAASSRELKELLDKLLEKLYVSDCVYAVMAYLFWLIPLNLFTILISMLPPDTPVGQLVNTIFWFVAAPIVALALHQLSRALRRIAILVGHHRRSYWSWCHAVLWCVAMIIIIFLPIPLYHVIPGYEIQVSLALGLAVGVAGNALAEYRSGLQHPPSMAGSTLLLVTALLCLATEPEMAWGVVIGGINLAYLAVACIYLLRVFKKIGGA